MSRTTGVSAVSPGLRHPTDSGVSAFPACATAHASPGWSSRQPRPGGRHPSGSPRSPPEAA